ncbi:MAG: hypothetical protein ACOYJU_01320 [Anaerovoracaceae bacterium]|jgi:hypothetical protein
MSKSRIYFQRANQFWTPTRDITINGYLNLLRYTKLDVDEKSVDIALGGHIPFCDGTRVWGDRVQAEKNLSYAMGIYYEEYYHDNPDAYFFNIHRNLKMRIAMVMVYIPDETGGEKNRPLPVVCCGTDVENQRLTIVDPREGTYREIALEDTYTEDQQKKMIILNVPGMVKMKGFSEKEILSAALILYIKRFCYCPSDDLSYGAGLEFFRCCRERKKNPAEIKGFMEHRDVQISWLHQLLSKVKSVETRDKVQVIEHMIRLYEKADGEEFQEELVHVTEGGQL